MIEKIITYALIAISVSLALAYLKKGATTKFFLTGSGKLILRMNKLYAVMGLIGFILGLFITIMIVITKGPLLVAAIVLIIFWGTGIPCWIYYRNHILKFDDKAIEVKSFYGKDGSILWSDISDISFNHFSGLLTILDNKGIIIKIHQHIVGLSSFVKMLEQKTSWTAEKLRMPIAK